MVKEGAVSGNRRKALDRAKFPRRLQELAYRARTSVQDCTQRIQGARFDAGFSRQRKQPSRQDHAALARRRRFPTVEGDTPTRRAISQSGKEAVRIRQKHASNRARFAEGTHFFKVTGRDLADLRVALGDSQIPPSARNITETAKLLQVQPKALFDFMSRKRWIYRRPGMDRWLASSPGYKPATWNTS